MITIDLNLLDTADTYHHEKITEWNSIFKTKHMHLMEMLSPALPETVAEAVN